MKVHGGIRSVDSHVNYKNSPLIVDKPMTKSKHVS